VIELLNGYIKVKVKNVSLELTKIQDQIDSLGCEEPVRAIGFEIPSEEQEEEDYE
jgi:hypothetical protein